MQGMNRRDLLWAALSVGATADCGCVARADTYPNRNIRMVVPFASGGTTDFVARVLAEKMSELAGQRFFVENKTGAAGMVGLREVASSAPDGYTLAVTDTSIATAPSLAAKGSVLPTIGAQLIN